MSVHNRNKGHRNGLRVYKYKAMVIAYDWRVTRRASWRTEISNDRDVGHQMRGRVCANDITTDISIKDFTDPLLHQFAVPLTGIVIIGTSGFEYSVRHACCEAAVFPRFKGSHAMRK